MYLHIHTDIHAKKPTNTHTYIPNDLRTCTCIDIHVHMPSTYIPVHAGIDTDK